MTPYPYAIPWGSPALKPNAAAEPHGACVEIAPPEHGSGDVVDLLAIAMLSSCHYRRSRDAPAPIFPCIDLQGIRRRVPRVSPRSRGLLVVPASSRTGLIRWHENNRVTVLHGLQRRDVPQARFAAHLGGHGLGLFDTGFPGKAHLAADAQRIDMPLERAVAM